MDPAVRDLPPTKVRSGSLSVVNALDRLRLCVGDPKILQPEDREHDEGAGTSTMAFTGAGGAARARPTRALTRDRRKPHRATRRSSSPGKKQSGSRPQKPAWFRRASTSSKPR